MLAIMLCAALALGQPESPAPLAGPAVAPVEQRETLVFFDLNGRLRRLETLPEAAAVALLKLPEGARAKAEAVVAERAAAIDRFVSENLLLLSQLDTATKAGGKIDVALMLFSAFDRVRPALAGGPVRERIIRALPAEEAGRFRVVFDEYWSAVVEDSLRENRAQGKHDERWQVDLGERIRHLAEEVGRSFERQLASGTLFVDYLLSDVQLTEAQRGTIRSLEVDMLRRTGARPTEEDQKQLGLGILAHLDEKQRLTVIRKIAGN